MLRLLHRLLTHNRVTSRLQRALVQRVKKLLYMPDGYYLMGQNYARSSPSRSSILEFIMAFEPTPQSAAILRQRMSKRPKVHVHEVALGDKE
jgi:hypothetical protein